MARLRFDKALAANYPKLKKLGIDTRLVDRALAANCPELEN